MKKLIPLLAIAAGATAYFVAKKIKEEKALEQVDQNEIKMIKLDSNHIDEVKDMPSFQEEVCILETLDSEVRESLEKVLSNYPYLEDVVVLQAFEYYEELKSKIKPKEKINIVHVAKFPLVENLAAYVKWIKNEGFQIREASEENVVLAYKEVSIKDSNFLDNIFLVANIVAGYKGEYEGFNVEKLA